MCIKPRILVHVADNTEGGRESTLFSIDLLSVTQSSTVDSRYDELLGTQKFACYKETLLYQDYKNNTIVHKPEIRDSPNYLVIIKFVISVLVTIQMWKNLGFTQRIERDLIAFTWKLYMAMRFELATPTRYVARFWNVHTFRASSELYSKNVSPTLSKVYIFWKEIWWGIQIWLWKWGRVRY